ncbi:MAG TPA: carboxypeptidase-like regulatory domain-containing protein, partial [Planctomycetaceae bacterium]|nr:carboxypeptidase-like regulatory domain-containing protein [Planctomycetaceae bacterium]
MRTRTALAWFLLLIVVPSSLLAAPRRGGDRASHQTISGVVVDAQGKPAPHAEVRAVWTSAPSGAQPRIERRTITADPHGRFELAVPGVPVLLLSRRGDDFSGPTLLAIDRQEIRLRLDRKPAVVLSGRVVSSDGKPLPNVTVEIRSRFHLPAKLVGAGEAFEFSGGQVIRTDAGGRFTTPAVPRTGLYQAAVAPPKRERAESEWVFLPPQGTAILRDLVVPRRISTRGTVADHAGRPLARAKVDLLFANGRESAASDSNGHFEFSSVPDGPALLTIQHSDCRFYGERLNAVPAALERRLTRLTEPSLVVMTTRPLMPRAERLRLAHILFDPYRDRLLAKPVELNKLGALARVGAALDPRDLVRQLREKASAVPALAADGLRGQIVQSLGADNMDEAREVIEEAAESGSKANILCGLCQAPP